MRASFLFLFCLSTLFIKIQSREFYPYSYDEIVFKLEKWQSEHSKVFRVHTARDKYNLSLPDSTLCSKRYGKCEHHIVIITNHETWDKDASRPHVFLSGALHGNERVGPTTLIELIDYLLFEYNHNKHNLWIQYLINNRVIILTPMTNSIGYAQSKREEQSSKHTIDPNRDFPYLVTKASDCMKSIVARMVNEIFREYLIQLAVTFHGGMRAISFEWGANNHKTPNDYSPDHVAQLQLVQNMQILGGHFPNKNDYFYPIGTLNKVVYAVNGGMEDWAYGGSWDKMNVIPCEPKTYNTYAKERSVYNDAMLRAFNFLIEASDAKRPKDGWGNIKNDWEDIWMVDHHEFDGHIPRNIRIAMFVINSVAPYVMIRKYPSIIAWDAVKNKFLDGKIHPKYKQNVKNMEWFVSGAMSLYSYDVLYAMKDTDNEEFNWEILEFDKNAMWRKNLDLIADRHKMASEVFKFTMDVDTKFTVSLMKQIVAKCKEADNFVKTEDDKVYCPIWFSIRVRVDDQWRDNRDLSNWKVVKTYPQNVKPQSHVVNARNYDQNAWNMTNNKYSVQAHKWWYTVKPVRSDIYFVYDDKDDVHTEYMNHKNNVEKEETAKHSIPWLYIVLFFCVVGVLTYFVRKHWFSDSRRRRMGSKTYQRVPQITIV